MSVHRCPRCDRIADDDRCPGCDRPFTPADVVGRGSARTLLTLLRDLVRVDVREHLALGSYLVRGIVLGSVVGTLAGVSSAVFLWGLQVVTETRIDNPWLLALLPVGGLVVGLLYHYLGDRSAGGNNLILDQIHGLEPAMAGDGPRDPAAVRTYVPRRLAGLVLVGTWVTHLFGGSAGREGTAIQMSGSLTDGFCRLARIPSPDRRLLLVAAVSGGFAAVFGVPMAGFVFGLEVRSIGRIRYDAIVPAATAALTGHLVFQWLDLPHDVTPAFELPETALSLALLGAVAVAGLVFALAAVLFAELTAGITRLYRVTLAWPPLRPFVGGLVVAGVALALPDGERYLGLSLPLIGDALSGTSVVWYAFAAKLLLTSLTLGAGFQGGEVTPLFAIGATLGAVLAGPLGVPPALLASIGFVAVFAAATNTPLACTIMGLELFGIGAFPYLAVGCVVAYVFASHRGIYGAQRIDSPKHPLRDGDLHGTTLRGLMSRAPGARRGAADGDRRG